MNTCKEPNIFSVASTDYILNRFIILEELGRGGNGIVYKVLDNETNEIVALKSTLFFSENNTDLPIEIEMGCKLISTRIHTHSLAIPINYAIVEAGVLLDEDFKYEINFDKIQKNSKGLIITFLLADMTLPDAYPQLTFEDKRDILFELIIAIKFLHETGVHHTDLTANNIVVKKINEKRSYTINGVQHIVTSDYLPIIIDFGEAEMYPMFNSDWHIDKYFSDLNTTVYENEEQFLLNPFFADLKYRTTNAGELVRIFADITINTI